MIAEAREEGLEEVRIREEDIGMSTKRWVHQDPYQILTRKWKGGGRDKLQMAERRNQFHFIFL